MESEDEEEKEEGMSDRDEALSKGCKLVSLYVSMLC
jgi:hypothetical protein